jgi:hypothetical protein
MTNLIVVADKDNPQDGRNLLWVGGNIIIFTAYRLAENHVYRTTSTQIAESCELITVPRDTYTMAISIT